MDELKKRVMGKMDTLVHATKAASQGAMSDDTYAGVYNAVLDDLVKMVIVSVAPPIGGQHSKVIDAGDDYSENKERWIAR